MTTLQEIHSSDENDGQLQFENDLSKNSSVANRTKTIPQEHVSLLESKVQNLELQLSRLRTALSLSEVEQSVEAGWRLLVGSALALTLVTFLRANLYWIASTIFVWGFILYLKLGSGLLRRGMQVWYVALVVMIGYETAKIKARSLNSVDADIMWDSVHRKYASFTYAFLRDLRGFWVKTGQYLR